MESCIGLFFYQSYFKMNWFELNLNWFEKHKTPLSLSIQQEWNILQVMIDYILLNFVKFPAMQ